MRKYIFLLLTSYLLLLNGCKPQQIVIHDIQYKDRVKVDSINILKHDSIRITQKGDTIFYQTFKTEYRDKYHLLHDSIYKYIETPVYIKKTVTVTTERKLHWYETLLIKVGLVTTILLILWLVWLFIKNYIPIVKFITQLFGNKK